MAAPLRPPYRAEDLGSRLSPPLRGTSSVLYLIFVPLWGQTDKRRRKTEDRRKIQGLRRHAEKFYLSRMLIVIFTCRTVTDISAGKVLVGFEGLAQHLAHSRLFSKDVSFLKCQLLVQ